MPSGFWEPHCSFGEGQGILLCRRGALTLNAHSRDAPPHPAMAKLTNEHLRALLLLARSPNGCTEAMLMAHGFPIEMLEELVTTGLAKASPDEMRIARKRRKIISFRSPRRDGRRPPSGGLINKKPRPRTRRVAVNVARLGTQGACLYFTPVQ